MASSVFEKPADYRPAREVPVLFSAETIGQRITALASEIRVAMGQEFLIVGLLRGSFVFAADLVRALHRAGCAPQIDFLTLSSYGAAKESSGQVDMHRMMSDSVAGKPVLLVDDILESGRTLEAATVWLRDQGAASVEACVLLDKPTGRTLPIEARFVGFEVPPRFVVGYGLDYAGYYRDLPFIGVLD